MIKNNFKILQNLVFPGSSISVGSNNNSRLNPFPEISQISIYFGGNISHFPFSPISPLLYMYSTCVCVTYSKERPTYREPIYNTYISLTFLHIYRALCLHVAFYVLHNIRCAVGLVQHVNIVIMILLVFSFNTLARFYIS
jgi:hypothetical protein